MVLLSDYNTVCSIENSKTMALRLVLLANGEGPVVGEGHLASGVALLAIGIPPGDHG